ncbi:hypothetical protein ACLOJK_026525 [Asimina triloba]
MQVHVRTIASRVYKYPLQLRLHIPQPPSAMKLVHLLSAILLAQTAVSTENTIQDTDGRPLMAHTEYYVRPSSAGWGGGLILSSRDRQCPLNVAQIESETSNGLPLTFAPSNSSENTVREMADIRIAFRVATVCVQSTAWRLGEVDPRTGRRYIVTGSGANGGGGGLFKVAPYGDAYKLVACPGVCMACNGGACEDVGVLAENGRRWLGSSVAVAPLSFVFKRV